MGCLDWQICAGEQYWNLVSLLDCSSQVLCARTLSDLYKSSMFSRSLISLKDSLELNMLKYDKFLTTYHTLITWSSQGYESVSVNPEDFEGQTVLIIGRGIKMDKFYKHFATFPFVT